MLSVSIFALIKLTFQVFWYNMGAMEGAILMQLQVGLPSSSCLPLTAVCQDHHARQDHAHRNAYVRARVQTA